MKHTICTFLLLCLITVASYLIFLYNPLSYRAERTPLSTELKEVTSSTGAVGDDQSGVGLVGDKPFQKLKLDELLIVKVSGTPYEIGYQHGLLLADEIRDLIKTFYKISGLEPNPLGWVRSIPVHYWAHSLYQAVPEKYRAEMQGIADGAKVSLKDIFLLNVYDEIFNFSGCTNLATWGSYTKDGEIVHGRNLDYLMADTLWNRQIVFLYEPAGSNPFISVTWPGVIGVLTGMNGEGLTLGSMTSKAKTDSPAGLPTGFLYREIMETAKNIGEVAQLLKRYPRTIGNNLMVTSKSEGMGVVFELTSGQVYMRSGEEMIAATNHFNALTSFGVPASAESTYRERRAEELAELNRNNNSFIDNEVMIEILDDRLIEHERLNPIGNTNNIQSVVFLPNRGELWIAANDVVPAAAGPFWGFKYSPYTDEPLKYIGSTTVHDTYLRSQIWFHRKDLSFWTDEKLSKVLYRYRERKTESIHFLHQKAELYLETGRYTTAVKFYKELLTSVEQETPVARDSWAIAYKYQLQFDLARAHYFADQPVDAGKILEKLEKQENLPDYLNEQVKEYLRKVRKLRAFDGKIYG